MLTKNEMYEIFNKVWAEVKSEHALDEWEYEDFVEETDKRVSIMFGTYCAEDLVFWDEWLAEIWTNEEE